MNEFNTTGPLQRIDARGMAIYSPGKTHETPLEPSVGSSAEDIALHAMALATENELLYFSFNDNVF